MQQGSRPIKLLMECNNGCKRRNNKTCPIETRRQHLMLNFKIVRMLRLSLVTNFSTTDLSGWVPQRRQNSMLPPAIFLNRASLLSLLNRLHSPLDALGKTWQKTAKPSFLFYTFLQKIFRRHDDDPIPKIFVGK